MAKGDLDEMKIVARRKGSTPAGMTTATIRKTCKPSASSVDHIHSAAGCTIADSVQRGGNVVAFIYRKFLGAKRSRQAENVQAGATFTVSSDGTNRDRYRLRRSTVKLAFYRAVTKTGREIVLRSRNQKSWQ